MPLFFAITLFVSAALLFLVQPMVGRMILPLLGGSPAVWNTCMVFFQTSLLLGYLYTHLLTTRVAPRRQVAVHLLVMVIPVLMMALGILGLSPHSPIPVLPSLAPQGEAYPVAGVLLLLSVAIGLPFFAVSTSAPLLQKWFASTGHRAGRDPYYLYGASNLGSLLALLAYPLLLEPFFPILEQNWIWAIGYGFLLVLVALAGQFVPASSRETPEVEPPTLAVTTAPPTSGDPHSPSLLEQLHWIVLAFVPSSLMLGVTYYATTDIAALPMLWVIPLALYLLTFIIAFARIPSLILTILTLIVPVMVLIILFMLHARVSPSYSIRLLLHFSTFFLVALLCHGELARRRPPTRYLTNFYLWLSVGGMLGGVFNGLLAPLLFTTTLEYPIALVAGCLCIPRLASKLPTPGERLRDLIWPVSMFAFVRLLGEFEGNIRELAIWITESSMVEWTGLTSTILIPLVLYGLPALLCYLFVERPLRFGLCVGAVVFATYYNSYKRAGDEVLEQARSYFGTLRVQLDNNFVELIHGTTLHGMQRLHSLALDQATSMYVFAGNSPLGLAGTLPACWTHWQYPGRNPLTYYHRTGPVGKVFDRLEELDPMGPIGVVGLGTGSLACYAKPGQQATFFEIDPTVIELVEPPKFFTYIHNARTQEAVIDFILGDARLKLAQQSNTRFAVLLVDAFSSDAIPVHLLTREAVALYFERVTEQGLVCLHTSNRHLDLLPIVAAIAADLHLVGLSMDDSNENIPGKTGSQWVVLARDSATLGRLTKDPDWQSLQAEPGIPAWTDDFSNLLSVLEFGELAWLRRRLGYLPSKVDNE